MHSKYLSNLCIDNGLPKVENFIRLINYPVSLLRGSLFKKWLEESKPSVLVDLGCGQNACFVLYNKGVNYIGIDPSSTFLERTNELYSSDNRKFL